MADAKVFTDLLGKLKDRIGKVDRVKSIFLRACALLEALIIVDNHVAKLYLDVQKSASNYSKLRAAQCVAFHNATMKLITESYGLALKEDEEKSANEKVTDSPSKESKQPRVQLVEKAHGHFESFYNKCYADYMLCRKNCFALATLIADTVDPPAPATPVRAVSGELKTGERKLSASAQVPSGKRDSEVPNLNLSKSTAEAKNQGAQARQ